MTASGGARGSMIKVEFSADNMSFVLQWRDDVDLEYLWDQDIICRVPLPVQNSTEERPRSDEERGGSAKPNKHSFYPQLSGLLTPGVVGYRHSDCLLILPLTGFGTKISAWLKSKSCVHNAQYGTRLYRSSAVIRA